MNKTVAMMAAGILVLGASSIVMACAGKSAVPSLNGKIVKVDTASLVVSVKPKGAAAKDVTVPTDNKTVVTLDGKAAAMGSLKEGMNVHVTPDTGTAVTIGATTPSLNGKVVKVDGTSLVVATGGKSTVTVATDGTTAVTLDGKTVALGDLKEGMYVHVTPATGPAAKIGAKTPKPKKAAQG